LINNTTALCPEFWLENRKGKDHSEDLGADGENNIRTALRKTAWVLFHLYNTAVTFLKN